MIRFFRFVLFLVSIFIIFFLVSLLLPSRVNVLKYVEIKAPSEKVVNQIVNFEQWKNWYPAFKDENISVIKNPPAKNVLSAVTLKDVNGKSINLNLIDTSGHIIDIQLQSSSSTDVNYQFIIVHKSNNLTQLTWSVNINLGWLPWKKVRGILMDKFSGQQFQTALEDLKKTVEN